MRKVGPERQRRMFSSAQDEAIQEMRTLRHQNMVRRQERLEELAKTDSEYVKSLDIKECMLEVQAIVLGKLAAEQNHFEGLAVRPGLFIGDLEERMQETEEAIKALQYWQYWNLKRFH